MDEEKYYIDRTQWHANEQLSKWFNNIVHFYNPCKSSRL